MQEQLITELAAARCLEVSPQRVREFASQGMLRAVPVREGPQVYATLYYTGEVLRLKELLRGQLDDAGAEEWPDVIDE